MFPSSFYDQLDPIYREELLKIVRKIEEIEKKGGKGSRKKSFALINDFSSNYLMPKELFMKRHKMLKFFCGYDRQRISAEYIYHLGHSRHKKLCHSLKGQWSVDHSPDKLSVEKFCYPHDKLKQMWKDYVMHYAETFIPKVAYQRYKKMKLLYSKISSAEENVEEWIKALSEAEDYDFVIDNVEFRLLENISDKKLWKLYLHYLQTNGHYMKLVETYSKYCRFFIGDTDMQEEYQKVAKTLCPAIIPWKNEKKFEIYSENFSKFYGLQRDAAPDNTVVPDRPYHFDFENVSPQKFRFRPNLMKYIVENAKASTLFDLFKTCKWFYADKPIEIVYRLNVATWINKGSIRHQTINIANPNHLRLDNKIYIAKSFTNNFRDDKLALSNFIPNIYRCTAKYVNIWHQNLTFDELKFLIGHGDVIDLKLSVKDQNGNQFKFEDILTLLPKIKRLDVHKTVCSVNISQFLCDFPFKNKIETFYFGTVKVLPDVRAFGEFILKNASPNHFCRFSFNTNFHRHELDRDGSFYSDDSDDESVSDDVEYDDEKEKEVFWQFNHTVNEMICKNWKRPKQIYLGLRYLR